MGYLNNDVLDSGLSTLTTYGTRLNLCTSEPATYAAATSTYSIAYATPSVGSPAARSPGGRKVTVAAIASGTVTGSATAAYWALSDVAGSRLLATGPLDVSVALIAGNAFSLGAFDIGIPAVGGV